MGYSSGYYKLRYKLNTYTLSSPLPFIYMYKRAIIKQFQPTEAYFKTGEILGSD